MHTDPSTILNSFIREQRKNRSVHQQHVGRPGHFYDRIAYRRAALDDPPAHHRNVVGGSATDNDLRRGSTRLVAGAGTARRESLFVPIPR